MAPLPRGGAGHRPALGAARPAGPLPALRHQRLLLDPALVGRRVEARITDREVLAVALDTGELACRHARSFASIGRSPRSSTPARSRHQRHERRGAREPLVEVRSLASYDALIA